MEKDESQRRARVYTHDGRELSCTRRVGSEHQFHYRRFVATG